MNCRRLYAKPNSCPDGSNTKRKMDTGFESYDETSKDDPPDWNRILVVGELRSNLTENNHEKTWLGLAQHAREVYRTQDRRFVLGFTLYGSTIKVALSTLHHRARRRRSKEEKAKSQQYLNPCEENAIAEFLLQMKELGQPVRMKYIASIAFSATRQRPPVDRPLKPPGLNWAKPLERRRPELVARKK